MTAKPNSLLAALVAVHGELPTLPKDAVNPHFRSSYTPLDTMVETVGPILTRHELVWIALPGHDETGRPALHYRLAHAPSGEEITGTMPLLLAKQDAQALGSALTYARRYALSAVLNLVSDEDTDGAPHARPPLPAWAAELDGAGKSELLGALTALTGPDIARQLGVWLKAQCGHVPAVALMIATAITQNLQDGPDADRNSGGRNGADAPDAISNAEGSGAVRPARQQELTDA